MKASVRNAARMFVILLLVCAATVFGRAQIVKAADDLPKCPAQGLDNFKLSYFSSSMMSVDLATNPLKADDQKVEVYADVEVKCGDEVVATKAGGSSTVNIFYNFKNNKVFYYRIHPYYNVKGGKKVYAAWTKYRAVCTLVPTAKLKKGPKIKIKVPKCAGVKSVTIQMSKKEKSGYKKLFKTKPGKSKTVKKFRGKKFKYYKYYYYRPVVTLKEKGVPCECPYYKSLWLYKVYR